MAMPKGYLSAGSHTGSSSEGEEDEETMLVSPGKSKGADFYYDLSRHGEVLMLVNPLMEEEEGGDVTSAGLRKPPPPPLISTTALESRAAAAAEGSAAATYFRRDFPGEELPGRRFPGEMAAARQRASGAGKRKNSCPVRQAGDLKRIKLEFGEEFDSKVGEEEEEPVDLRLDFARHMAFEREAEFPGKDFPGRDFPGETASQSSSPTSSSSSSPAVILSVPRYTTSL